MKLISLNIERDLHYAKWQPFILTETPDIVCLQEAPEELCDWFRHHGYHVTFAPMCRHSSTDNPYQEGVLLASLLDHTATTHYYYGSASEIPVHNPLLRRESVAHVVVVATVGKITIATTHLPAPPHGELFYEPLAIDISNLRTYLASIRPHALCGDMNTPRGINPSYPDLVAGYTDYIPVSYQSSLDGTIHRLGSAPDKAHLFSTFMVDYLLATPEFSASNVRLAFGLSDHAAIVATLAHS